MEPNTLSLSRTSSTTRDGDNDSTVGIEAESFIVSANDRQI